MSKKVKISIDGLDEDIFKNIDNEFINYIHEFYGKDSIYGMDRELVRDVMAQARLAEIILNKRGE